MPPRTRKKKSSGARALVAAAERLRDGVQSYVERGSLGPAAYVLNPLDYAWDYHREYLERYAPPRPGVVEAVLVGMNPGPWGMAQTGVPFGSPDVVESFLGIRGPVEPPERTHPKRPILGWSGTRGEVSGRRLWGGIEACFGTPEAFFARFFVVNFCPLVFQSETGANVIPEKLPKDAMQACQRVCEEHAGEVLERLAPRMVIGVGKWAERQMKAVVSARGLAVEVGSILHPSPASPAANKGWLPVARRQLEELGHPWPDPA